MTNGKIRVLVVEDHMVARMGLNTLIDNEEGMCVIGEAKAGAEGVEKAFALRPDVVVMDLRMPGVDGIAATDLIVKQDPNIKVLVFSSFDAESDVVRARDAGASGYILKNSEGDELLHAIREVHAGRRYFPEGIAERLEMGDQMTALGTRDQQLLEYLVRGLNNPEIAKVSGLTRGTVRIYLTRLFGKLQVSNRTEAVTAAFQMGLVRPDWTTTGEDVDPTRKK
jgi:DNA-binding NarL/FixJ family response regulator